MKESQTIPILCLDGITACNKNGSYIVYDKHGIVQIIALGIYFDPILMTTTLDSGFEYFFIDSFPMPDVGDRSCKSFFYAKKEREKES